MVEHEQRSGSTFVHNLTAKANANGYLVFSVSAVIALANANIDTPMNVNERE